MKSWEILFDPDFFEEIADLPPDVKIRIAAGAKHLSRFGPAVTRPQVDRLKGSAHANMKELRFDAAGGV